MKKYNLIDVINLWNKILVVIGVINVLLSIITIFIKVKELFYIIYTVDFFIIVFGITEFKAIKHNDRVLKRLYNYYVFK